MTDRHALETSRAREIAARRMVERDRYLCALEDIRLILSASGANFELAIRQIGPIIAHALA